MTTQTDAAGNAGRRTNKLQVLVNDDELERVRRRAADDNLPLGVWLRKVALDQAGREEA